MNALLKKEVRLLLPGWTIASSLALVQAVTRPYDFYIAALLFIGMTILSLASIGRETSANTFSLLLAQPAERIVLWKTKLLVLSAGFIIIFVIWIIAYGFAAFQSPMNAADSENSLGFARFPTANERREFEKFL